MSEHLSDWELDGTRDVTGELYAPLVTAYDHFNRLLFDGQLPGAIITLQRHTRYYGYFSRSRHVNPETNEKTDEIALNPGFFAIRPIEATLGTLVHEMTHQRQALYGEEGRRGYHNRQFADWMKEVGLPTTATGRPGGKDVGESITQIIVPGGRFMSACALLLDADFKLAWVDRFPMANEALVYVPTEEDLRELYPHEAKSGEQEGLPSPTSAEALVEGTSSLHEQAELPVDAPSPDRPSSRGATADATPDGSTDPAWEGERSAFSNEEPRVEENQRGRPGGGRTALSAPPVESGIDVQLPQAAVGPGQKKSTRTKFKCPGCRDAAWGKPTLQLICGKCNLPLEGEEVASAS